MLGEMSVLASGEGRSINSQERVVFWIGSGTDDGR